MASQGAKTKRPRSRQPRKAIFMKEAPEGLLNGFLEDIEPPVLTDSERHYQRTRLQKMGELREFRASFARGYMVILSELANKLTQGNQKL